MEIEKIEAIAYRTIEDEFTLRQENDYTMDDFGTYVEAVVTVTNNIRAEAAAEKIRGKS
ncbi:MAG: hypothetical protein IJN27_02420 [Oscillospiraceae bacterium]|nr:hypothetical protein [Oscillospiraceae bacterium]